MLTVREGFYDEMFDEGGAPRAHARTLVAALAALGPDGLAAAGRRRDAIFMQQGITFDAADRRGRPGRDRPFPLDLVPRIIPAAEWTTIKRGLAQRIRALNAFVDDVYHGREIVRERARAVGAGRLARALRARRARHPPAGRRVLPRRAAATSSATATARGRCSRTTSARRRDLVRAREPRRDDAPAPGLFTHYRVRPVDHYPQLLLAALRAVAPTGAEEEATVVVWTPGPFNSAYFEHAFLARQMGVELVEAGDLVVRDDGLYMRTTGGLERVHAVYRRLDDDFVDPLEFRPDSALGVPGLVRAYRAGTVAIANAIGTGVADDKAIYHYVPEMIRFYLDEEPLLDNVPTYLLADAEQREHVLSRLHELVVKPTGESGGKGVFIGPLDADEELARLAEESSARSRSSGSPRRS